MKIFQSRLEIGNEEYSFHVYVDGKIFCHDMSAEETKDFLEEKEKEADLAIRLVETRVTDNGIDYYWNLIVDGTLMYLEVPREFAEVVIDALLYRR